VNKLAYLILGILVERFHQHLTQSKHITNGQRSLSDLWKRVESLYQSASFEEMQSALDTLVDAGLVERHGNHVYSFRVTRIEYPKKSA